MTGSVTLRSHLMGSLTDLVEAASLGTTGKCSVICELVSLFVDYREEGTSLFLDVFVTNDLDQLISLIPQSTYLRLGCCTLDEEGVVSAVKKTAPLVRGSWKMYLSPSADGLDFGVFRDSGHPLNVSLDFGVQSGEVGDAKFIRVTKLTQDAVRVSAHNGNQVVIHFSNAKEGLEEVEYSLDALAELICSSIEGTLSHSSKTYITALLNKAVRESHGVLIAVVKKRVPSFLKDSIVLDPPLDIGSAVESVLRDAGTIPELQALESLILGMFASDGIVIFDTKAQLLAYRAFTKLKPAEAVGGARRRAYQVLCERVGHGLEAAFFQSQDGASSLKMEQEVSGDQINE